MITKKIYWGDWHILKCDICYRMEQRGYRYEVRYWNDFFAHKLKPIKYRLVKAKKG